MDKIKGSKFTINYEIDKYMRLEEQKLGPLLVGEWRNFRLC